MKELKDVFRVKYQITDRGVAFPEKEEDIVVPKGASVLLCLEKHIRKYRHASDLSTKFTLKPISYYHNGYCK